MKPAFDVEELSLDAFLGGRLQLWQPRRGYRAGVDPVLLAASVPARTGQAVLELGCGAGAAFLALGARVPGLSLVGLELQPAYADLACRNMLENGVDGQVIEGDLSAPPAEFRQLQVHHVIANPPYYRADAHSPSHDPGRRTALREETPLADWVDVAARRLVHGGHLHMIQKADRLPDMLSAIDARLGAVEVLPLSARPSRSAELVILRARKGGKTPFRLHAPLILHEGDRHERDAEHYRPAIRAVLRDGAALPWPESGRPAHR
ncbi:tRNA1(Val) (adenine(37)-N6)-methyltransferase [Lutimaribacter marinistellae]|uniref:tRNA1(Val) (Adenine(37)-N6)-methyltransferase n=1 Tax=Lutimaribacter marinistellae TaxID=1820329 RepID=A0ABV7TH04_9RHOB